MQNDNVTFDLYADHKDTSKFVAKNVTGGTASPFKGKMQGGMGGGNKGGGKGFGGKGGKGFGKGGGKNFGGKGKGGFGKNNYGDCDDQEDDEYGGKTNNGKGILPGGRHDTWYKGGEKGEPIDGGMGIRKCQVNQG